MILSDVITISLVNKCNSYCWFYRIIDHVVVGNISISKIVDKAATANPITIFPKLLWFIEEW